MVEVELWNCVVSILNLCYANQWCGLEAPPGVWSKRIIVIVVNGDPLVLINPEIISQSDNQVIMNEGCLSIPGEYMDIKRPESISVKFRDRKGRTHLNTYSGLTARVIQHEIDHLDGKLMVEYGNDWTSKTIYGYCIRPEI